MKTFRMFGLLLVAVLVSVGFAACSSDDGDEDNGGQGVSLVGTWVVESNTASEPEVGTTMTLKADGHLVMPDGGAGDSWKVEGDRLLINLSEHWGSYDDGLYGSFTMSGNTVTYSYNWWTKYEEINKNPSSFTQTMVLKKK